MNNIIIDKNYSVIADGNGCTLVFVGEPYIKKGKNVTPRDRWYYNNIGQCLKKYVQESLEKDTVTKVEDILSRLDVINKVIDETVNNVYGKFL